MQVSGMIPLGKIHQPMIPIQMSLWQPSKLRLISGHATVPLATNDLAQNYLRRTNTRLLQFEY